MKHLLILFVVWSSTYNVYAQHRINMERTKVIMFPPPVLPDELIPISVNDVSKHDGEWVIVTGKLYGHRYQKDRVLLYMGAPFPKPLLILSMEKGTIADLEHWNKRIVKATGKLLKDKSQYEL